MLFRNWLAAFRVLALLVQLSFCCVAALVAVVAVGSTVGCFRGPVCVAGVPWWKLCGCPSQGAGVVCAVAAWLAMGVVVDPFKAWERPFSLSAVRPWRRAGRCWAVGHLESRVPWWPVAQGPLAASVACRKA